MEMESQMKQITVKMIITPTRRIVMGMA